MSLNAAVDHRAIWAVAQVHTCWQKSTYNANLVHAPIYREVPAPSNLLLQMRSGVPNIACLVQQNPYMSLKVIFSVQHDSVSVITPWTGVSDLISRAGVTTRVAAYTPSEHPEARSVPGCTQELDQ